jgi:hypothetical protein
MLVTDNCYADWTNNFTMYTGMYTTVSTFIMMLNETEVSACSPSGSDNGLLDNSVPFEQLSPENHNWMQDSKLIQNLINGKDLGPTTQGEGIRALGLINSKAYGSKSLRLMRYFPKKIQQQNISYYYKV